MVENPRSVQSCLPWDIFISSGESRLCKVSFLNYVPQPPYAIPAEGLESGMTPVGKHGDQVFGNPPFGQEHLKDLVPEDRLQLFQVQGRSDPEHAPPVEASVGHQDMAVGIESQEVAKGLDGDDGAGGGILFRHRLLEKELQGFPGTATQIGKKIPVIEKVPAQDLRDAEDEMPVGNLFQHICT